MNGLTNHEWNRDLLDGSRRRRVTREFTVGATCCIFRPHYRAWGGRLVRHSSRGRLMLGRRRELPTDE